MMKKSRKAEIGNIVAAVLMFMIFIVLSMSLYHTSIKNTVRNFRNVESVFLEEAYAGALDALLDVDEPITGERYSWLIAMASFTGSEFVFNGITTINVTHEFMNGLEEIYGNNNFLGNVYPPISGISLDFVFDGSGSMLEERQMIMNEIPFILSHVSQQNRINVEVMVYILSSNKNLCFDFLSAGIKCRTISDLDIYAPPYLDCDTSSDDYRIANCISAPYRHDPYADVQQSDSWTEEFTNRSSSHYFESDWAAGVSYALHQASFDLADFHVILPVSEELSTSSFSHLCFINYDTENWESTYCDMCVSSGDVNTLTRSFESVQNAVKFSDKVPNDLILPIYSGQYLCDYAYFDYNRHDNLEFYFNSQGISTPADATFCDISQCPGCAASGSLPGNDYVCLHPELSTDIMQHMQILAQPTGGDVLEINSLSSLPDLIAGMVADAISRRIIIMGEEKDLSRFAFERRMFVPGAASAARLNLFRYGN